jgi:hypothetical protein
LYEGKIESLNKRSGLASSDYDAALAGCDRV